MNLCNSSQVNNSPVLLLLEPSGSFQSRPSSFCLNPESSQQISFLQINEILIMFSTHVTIYFTARSTVGRRENRMASSTAVISTHDAE